MGILLKQANSKSSIFFLVIIGFIQFNSCKKESPVTIDKTFLKTYQTDSSAESVMFEQMPDGGFIIISTEGSGRPLITRTDKGGNLKWEKIILKYSFPLNTSTTTWNAFNTIDAGHFMAQSGSVFTIFDTLGNVDYFSSIVGNTITGFGVLAQQGSNYIAPSCDGEYSGAPSVNKMYVFDNTLNLEKEDSFPDAAIGGKTLTFFLNYYNTAKDFMISGIKFPRKSWNFGNPDKIFAARFFPSGKVIENIIDSGMQRYSDALLWSTNTNDSSMILLGERTDLGTSYKHPLVIKIDKNLKTIWQKEFDTTSTNTVLNNMTVCRDGGLIMVGATGNSAYENSQPYILKIDKDGNKQWDKTISAVGNSVLYFAKDLDDGGYGFLGYSNGFGNQLLGTRILFVKTDANGNL